MASHAPPALTVDEIRRSLTERDSGDRSWAASLPPRPRHSALRELFGDREMTGFGVFAGPAVSGKTALQIAVACDMASAGRGALILTVDTLRFMAVERVRRQATLWGLSEQQIQQIAVDELGDQPLKQRLLAEIADRQPAVIVVENVVHLAARMPGGFDAALRQCARGLADLADTNDLLVLTDALPQATLGGETIPVARALKQHASWVALCERVARRSNRITLRLDGTRGPATTITLRDGRVPSHTDTT